MGGRLLGTSVALAVLGLLMAAAPSGAGLGVFEKKAEKKGLEIPKLTTYSYINDSEEAGRLTLVANTEVGRFRLEDPYIPVVFILAVDRGKRLRLSAERFRLLLPDGTELAPVSFKELLASGYTTELRFDRQRFRDSNATGGWFVSRYRLIQTNLYPDPSSGEVVIPEVHLYGNNYAMDALYFPNPGELKGRILRLVYEDPEAQPENRIDARFRFESPSERPRSRKKK